MKNAPGRRKQGGEGAKNPWARLKAELDSPKPDPALLKMYARQVDPQRETFATDSEWQTLKVEIDDQYREMVRRYEGELRERLRQAGYTLDGVFPDLVVDGLVQVSIKASENKARVGGRRTANLSMPLVVKAIQKEWAGLWGREFRLEGFVTKLRAAYYTVCERAGQSREEYVPLTEVYNQLRATGGAYTKLMFAADLSRMLEAAGAAGVSSDYELAPVRDARKAIYVYDRETRSGKYIGLIRFGKGEEHGA